MNPVFNAIRPVASSLRFLRGKRNLAAAQDAYAEIGRIVTSPFSAEDTYEKFAAQVKKIIDHDRITISTIDPESDTFKLEYVLGTEVKGMSQGAVSPLVNSFVSQVANSRQPIRCDPSNEYPNLKLLLDAGLISSIATPLIANENVIGVLHVASSTKNGFSEQDLYILERIGNQIAGAMASAILLQAEQNRDQKLKGVYRVAEIIAKNSRIFEEKAHAIVEILGQLSLADLAVLWRGDQFGDDVELVATAGIVSLDLEESILLIGENSATGNAFRKGTPIVINDYSKIL